MKTIFRVASLIATVSLIGAGCSQSPSSDSPSPSSPPEARSGAPAVGIGRSDCFNLYYPLKAGSTIEYKMSSGNPLSIHVAEHTKDSIKLDYTFTVKGQQSTMTNELVCDNGNIHGKGFFDFASRLSGLDISYETLKMEGEVLPSDLTVGRAWTLDTEVVVHTNDARMQAILEGKHQTTHIESKVVGEEDVTVAAGTFHALKIEQTIMVDTGIQAAKVTTTGMAWYVKDIGLVKSENKIGTAVSGMEATKITE
ncbi:MAG: hypothetical protein ABIO72_01255 [Patescibacteria group bacterium]